MTSHQLTAWRQQGRKREGETIHASLGEWPKRNVQWRCSFYKGSKRPWGWRKGHHTYAVFVRPLPIASSAPLLLPLLDVNTRDHCVASRTHHRPLLFPRRPLVCLCPDAKILIIFFLESREEGEVKGEVEKQVNEKNQKLKEKEAR